MDDADAGAQAGRDLMPARTSFGIHVLDEDGIFDLGIPSPSSRDVVASVATVHGIKLRQTVLLPAQLASHPSAADAAGDTAGDTVYGIRAPELSVPVSSVLPGRALSEQTFVGAPSGLDEPGATMLGISPITVDESMPRAQLLGELNDTWVDQMFDDVALSEAQSSPFAADVEFDEPGLWQELPKELPKELPDLVRPERPTLAPGFGIVRKKKKIFRSGSALQNRVVASAGSYENHRAEPERPNVASFARTALSSDPKADSPPVARITTPMSAEQMGSVSIEPDDVSGPQEPPSGQEALVGYAKQFSLDEMLTLDVAELGGDDSGVEAQLLPDAEPRDRLSPISVRAVTGDSLKPLPVTSAGFPRHTVQMPGVAAPAVSHNDSVGPGRTAAFSPQAMAGAEQIGEPSVASGDALTVPPVGGIADVQPRDQTIGFSPMKALTNFETRGVTPPGGTEVLESEDVGVLRFLGQGLGEPEPLDKPLLQPPKPPAAFDGAVPDLFSVAQRAGVVDPDDANVPRALPSVSRRPRHLTDASRNSSETWRQVILIVVVVVLLVALSFLGVLLYEEFTSGASPQPTPTEEGSG